MTTRTPLGGGKPSRPAPGRRGVSLLTTGHDVGDARLHRIADALRRRGLAVEVVALGAAADAPPGVAFRSLGRRGSLLRRGGNALSVPFRAGGAVVLVLDPELILSASVACLARRRRLVVDVHEDYLALLDDRPWARSAAGTVARAVARGATMLARRADITVVADAHVPPGTARNRLVVRNLPALRDLPEPGELGPEPRALYVGDVRRSRGLQAMVEAVEAAPPWRLDVVGPVAAADAAWLEANPPSERVVLHGRLPLERAWALAQGAWAGMCLLDDTPAFREAVPTKLYEYLSTGLAVLASPLPRIAPIVTESGAGALVTNPAEASSTLARWYAEPDLVRKHQAAGRLWAEQNLAGSSPFDDLAAEIDALFDTSSGLDRS